MKMFLSAFVALVLAGPAAASFELPEGQPCADVPFHLTDNRAVFDVTIGGKGPFQFIFDTGANSILDRDLAKNLDLPMDEAGQSGGAGADTQAMWRLRVPELSFSGVNGRDARFLSLDLSAIRRAIGFERLDGLMGREVLDAYLVRYDYDRSVLTLCDPKSAPAIMRSGTPVPFTWNDWAVPIVDAAVDGRMGQFIVDTGDRSSLTVFRGFTNQHQLRAAYPRRVQSITGYGVGGPIPADVVRADTFAFGGFAIPGVTLRMPLLESGAFATDELAGSIGSGVLRRFNTTYDYGARVIYMTPNKAFAMPDRYDRSGMWLVTHERGYRVEAIVDGGPAFQSGLRVGDVLTHADGAPVAGISLIALRDRLMDAATGTRIGFRYVRAGSGPQEAIVVLRDLLKN